MALVNRAKIMTAVAVPLLAASTILATAPSASAANSFTCKGYGRGGVTNASTPVHVAPSGSAAITSHIAAGRTVHLYYECINSAGNVWYEITGNIDGSMNSTARFIWSSYIK